VATKPIAGRCCSDHRGDLPSVGRINPNAHSEGSSCGGSGKPKKLISTPTRSRLSSPLRESRFQLEVGAMVMTTSAAISLLARAIRLKASAASVCTTKAKAYAASAASLGVP
jgi:hypothetical protein